MVTLFIISFAYYILSDDSFDCSTDFDYQKNLVIDHLASKGLNIEYLKNITSPDNECQATFLYESYTDKIEFRVTGGYNVVWYDYNVHN